MARRTAVRRMKTRAASKTNNYTNMIEAALASLEDCNGSSRAKIALFIASYYKADTKGLQVALKLGVGCNIIVIKSANTILLLIFLCFLYINI